MSHYVAVILKEPDSAYGVIVPDLPGCFSGGDTLDEAIDNATEAVRIHVEALLGDGREAPKARPLDEVRADPRHAELFAEGTAIMVPLLLDLGRKRRVNLSIDENLLEVIDREARRRGLTRSSFLTNSALAIIEGGRGGGGTV